jgi:hypothetical protein
VAKRSWKESKLVISLPDEIIAEYADDATQLYTSTVAFIRQYLIDGKRRPQTAAAAPTITLGPRTSRSGFKGVYAYGKRWEAVAYVGKQRRRLGVYDDAETAARAYDDFLIAQTGDANAAVNFPTPADGTRAAHAPFVERFASGGKLTDIEWGQWKEASKGQPAMSLDDAPLSVAPNGPLIDSSTPLIERSVKTLYRRDSASVITIGAPPAVEDPIPAEPDEGPPEHVS